MAIKFVHHVMLTGPLRTNAGPRSNYFGAPIMVIAGEAVNHKSGQSAMVVNPVHWLRSILTLRWCGGEGVTFYNLGASL